MASGYEVDPALLRSAGGRFSVTGNDLSAAWERHLARMPTMAAMFGDPPDASGQHTLDKYRPAAHLAETAVRHAAAGISDVRGAVCTVADNYDRAGTPPVVEPPSHG